MEVQPAQNEIYQSIREVILTAKSNVKKSVDFTMVQAYWEIGRQIIESQEGPRAEYGKSFLKFLAEKLTAEFGVSFSSQNLRNMRQFYLTFQKRYTLCSELSWSHYRRLMRVSNEEERNFYVKECAECNCAECNWSVRKF